MDDSKKRRITPGLMETCELLAKVYGVEGILRKSGIVCERLGEALISGYRDNVMHEAVNAYIMVHELWYLFDSNLFQALLEDKLEVVKEQAEIEYARKNDIDGAIVRFRISPIIQ